MKLITWIVLLVFARSPWQQKADSLINPPLMQQAESILRFDKSTLDIGTLTEDDAPQAYRFTGQEHQQGSRYRHKGTDHLADVRQQNCLPERYCREKPLRLY